MECIKTCKDFEVECPNKQCRYWLDYSPDLNCTFIAIEQNGAMILEDIGERLSVTPARIHQIQTKALKKLSKKNPLLRIIQE